MDKTVSRTYSFKNQEKEDHLYLGKTASEKAAIFNELMRIAYQFEAWPRMDKTVFSTRKFT